ncbi:MAG: tetratricopeptide repeat protein [Phycisphaerae bacterium]
MHLTHFPNRRGGLWAGFVLALTATAPLPTARGEGHLNLPTMAQASNLVRDGKWSEATQALRKILDVQPDNGSAWFQLGYALHADGKLEEAIKINTKAAQYRPVRATALYNLACEYSLTGREKPALTALRDSYRAGFHDRNAIEADQDLSNIRKLPGFALPADQVLEEMDLSDGKLLDYYLALPPNYDETRNYPVLLAFPPGNQSRAAAQTGMTLFWGEQAAQRGWIVLSLIKPASGWMSDTGVGYMRELMEEMDGRFNVEGGKYYVAGCSGGGASSFHIAMALADRVHAVLGVPAYPDTDDDASLQRLKTLPVRMFCGGDDEGWLVSMKRSRQRLKATGVDATLTVYPGEGHVMQSLRGGGFADILESLRRDMKSSKP